MFFILISTFCAKNNNKKHISCTNMSANLVKQSMAHTTVFWVYPLLFFKSAFVSFTAHHSSNENAHKDRLCGCCPRAIRYRDCPHTNNITASLRVFLPLFPIPPLAQFNSKRRTRIRAVNVHRCKAALSDATASDYPKSLPFSPFLW